MNKLTPPYRALQFLRWFCREDYVEEIEGDLTELFEKQYQNSPARAKRNFVWSVIRYFRPEFIKSFKSNLSPSFTDMFRHNLLITYRNFLRYKSSFFINLFGLSTGLAAVLLIYLWVHDELSFDKFHKNNDRLYQVMRNLAEGPGVIHTFDGNSDLLAPALGEEMAEIEFVVPVSRPFPHGILSSGERSLKATGKFVGKDFFKVFSFPLRQGDKVQVLLEKYAIVISDALAIKLFGSTDNVVGKTITWDQKPHEGVYVVSGVFEASGYHSSEHSDFLLNHEKFREKNNQYWDNNNVQTFLTLREGVDVDQFNDKIRDFVRQKFQALYGKEHLHFIATLFLRPYADKYLYNRYENGVQAGGRIDYVILFSTVALFILVIACINFMNLSTARASRRLKEVGIKKAIGAFRKTLVFQYISESMLLAFLSLLTSVLLAFLLLPRFNLITGKQLTLGVDPNLILGALIITLITGFISGSYPALYLSGFKPVEILKGKLNIPSGELWARRGLVIFQFTISILLIVSVVVIYRQIDFVQSKNLGYVTDNVMTIEQQGKLNESLESFLLEAKNIPGVVNASTMWNDIGFPGSTGRVNWQGKKDRMEFNIMEVGYDLVEVLEIKIKEGRSFSKTFSSENSKLILNEMAVESMGLTDPLGKTVNLWDQDYQIIGVAKNFHIESLYESVQPCLIKVVPHAGNIVVKIQAGTERQTISGLEKLYHKYNPGISFDFKFLDDEYQALYVAEQKVADLSMYFAAIAILISCLGLFGLAAFTAERRTKEIGIRKILGCSELGIISLLSGDFTRMVLISITIALPVSFFLAKYWLESFAYRIKLEWWFFIGAGLIALLVAWITVGMQTVKAARINPAQSLKEE